MVRKISKVKTTWRNLPTRLKEHRAHGRTGDSIVKHSHIKDHQIDWQAAQLITPINSWHTRRIREAIKIFMHDTVPQDISFFISDIWRPLLRTEGSSISKVHNPPQTEGSKSTTLPPPVLVNNWFSSVSTHSSPPTPRIPVPSVSRLHTQRTNPPASSLHVILQQSP